MYIHVLILMLMSGSQAQKTIQQHLHDQLVERVLLHGGCIKTYSEDPSQRLLLDILRGSRSSVRSSMVLQHCSPCTYIYTYACVYVYMHVYATCIHTCMLHMHLVCNALQLDSRRTKLRFIAYTRIRVYTCSRKVCIYTLYLFFALQRHQIYLRKKNLDSSSNPGVQHCPPSA